MQQQPNNTLIKVSAIAIIVCTIFLSIMAMVMSSKPSDFLGKSMGIASSLIFYGLTAALALSAYSKESTRNLSIVAMAISALGFLLSSLVIVFEIESTILLKFLFALFILAIALAQITMLYKINIINKWAAISRVIAVAAISIFSLMIILLIFSSDDNFAAELFMRQGMNESLARGFIALLALDFGFTAATPLLNKINEGRYEVEDPINELLQEEV